MNLLERVERSIGTRKLLVRGQGLLVAVSGGVDSMVLLRLLHDLAPRYGWGLTVAHFNHQLRGRSSDADERFVCATAKRLALPFVVGRADVRKHAYLKKISIEMAARDLRHGFLASAAGRRKIPIVVLAHHADDQVELFFLRLLRGSGGEGLAGMKWRSPSAAQMKGVGGQSPKHQAELVRPLLEVSKAELERFAQVNKIRFRADASNASQDFLRNRIRSELLPLLRKNYQPALDKVVLRTMEIVGGEVNFVSESARKIARLGKMRFERFPIAVQRRVLQSQLLELGVTPEFDLIEQLRGEVGRIFAVSPQLRLTRDASGAIRICPESDDEDGNRAEARAASKMLICLRKAGRAAFDGAKISWNIERQDVLEHPKPLSGQEVFDADMVGNQIVLRHRRFGDRFQPIGMSEVVKLQDLLVNAKIQRERREELLVATTVNGDIFWVEGLRMSEGYKLTPATKRRLFWHWQRGNH